jgi:hypothetical protein
MATSRGSDSGTSAEAPLSILLLARTLWRLRSQRLCGNGSSSTDWRGRVVLAGLREILGRANRVTAVVTGEHNDSDTARPRWCKS